MMFRFTYRAYFRPLTTQQQYHDTLIHDLLRVTVGWLMTSVIYLFIYLLCIKPLRNVILQ